MSQQDMKVKLPALLGTYDRQTNQQNNQPTDGHTGSKEDFTSNNNDINHNCSLIMLIIIMMNTLANIIIMMKIASVL